MKSSSKIPHERRVNERQAFEQTMKALFQVPKPDVSEKARPKQKRKKGKD
jgi:hypothetical protein